MASILNSLPFRVGDSLDSVSGGFLAGAIGTLYKTYDVVRGDRLFRLVQNGNAVMPINSMVISAVVNGRKNWVVSTNLSGPSSYNAGIVPEEYTATIPANNYFLLQVGGNALVLAGDSLFSSLSGVESRLVSGSAGSGYARQLAAFSSASITEEMGVFALAANTIAATAVGATVRVLLRIALDD